MQEAQKVRVKIKENSPLARLAAWRLKSANMAMVMGKTIHLWGVTRAAFLASPSWLRHELKHVEQYQRLGVVRFLWTYFIESIRFGYTRNKFEKEARLAEKESSPLDKYEIVPH